jgi:histone H3/H4
MNGEREETIEGVDLRGKLRSGVCDSYIWIFVFHRYLCAIHAKRVTLMQRDIQLARRIRGPQAGLG